MNKPIWLSTKKGTPARGYWDMALLEDILKLLPETKRQIIVIPGAYQTDYNAINQQLNNHEQVLVIVTSDEESNFDTEKLSHKDMIIYSTYPVKHKKNNIDYWLPLGYTPHTRENLQKFAVPEKPLNWFFSGQITHKSRENMAQELRKIKVKGKLVETDGFAQGMKPETYMKYLWNSKVVPSAGGPVNSDAFRTYEALEAGAIPLPENKELMNMLFDSTPFIVQDDWQELKDYIKNYAERYPDFNNEVFAWWQFEKWKIIQRFKKDLDIIDDITVIIPTSPIPSNPSLDIISKSIKTIRHHLPNADIIIMIDGVREEQHEMNTNYQRFIQNLLWKCNFDNKLYPYLFTEHRHQASMTKQILKHIATPTILFVEHDTPITPDENIDFDNIIELVKSGAVDIMRFHFEAQIHPEHKHMMLDDVPIESYTVPYMRTAQWSQRPHVASTDYYRRILQEHFSDNSRTMIEDVMHGIVYGEYQRRKKAGWNNHKLAIYTPPGNIKRSYHTDGRDGDKKYDDRYIK